MACILVMSKQTNMCIGDEQKASSLKGCWWGKTKSIIADGSLKRNMLFMATIKDNKEEKKCAFQILSVFQKSNNKWQIEAWGPSSKV
eukprot:14529276-Ditylum_brightwellii.AAC.1